MYAGLDWAIDVRKQMHEKRMRKIDTMLKNESVFVPEVVNDNAEYFFVTFGSTTDSASEAIDILKSKGKNFGLISFSYLMPLDKEKIRKVLEGKKLINVEGNYTGQLAQIIRMNTGIEIKQSILKYDGEAFTGSEIARRALALIGG